jgi:high-affinity iron transporter
VQAAILTGVLGIPSDPRLIEVLGWFAYLVPTLLYLLWPVTRRPTAASLSRVRFGIAAGLAAIGIVLAVAVVLPGAPASTAAPIVAANGTTDGRALLSRSGSDYTLTATVAGVTSTHHFAKNATTTTSHAGTAARGWQSTVRNAMSGKPTTLTLTDLVALAGGRVPIGVNASDNPGPFAADWNSTTTTSVWLTGNALLDAASRTTTVVTISGGGLASPRTISADSATPSWAVTPGYPAHVVAATSSAAASSSELLLWKLWLPIALWLAAVVVSAYALRSRITFRADTARRQQQARVDARAPHPASARV